MRKFGRTGLGRYGIFFSIGLLVLVVIIVIFYNKNTNRNTNENFPETTVSQSGAAQASALETAGAPVSAEEEMVAVWVPYFSLNMGAEEDKSEAAFQKKFDRIVSDAKTRKINTLIVQVRPFGDAFYPSSLFPWSSYLTGTQGADPGYDPLAYMVEAAHENGLQIHAWVNPLRLRVSGVPQTLAADSLVHRWENDEEKQDWCLSWADTDGIYLNPGIAAVRQYIADGVREIVENYDVDGIQFDDYFYPTEDSSFDEATYQAYCDSLDAGETALSQSSWRMENISALIALVYKTVKETDPDVVFGVSPQGNVENDEKIGADVTAWCSTAGYVDYICPQLYYNFENPYLPYDKAAEQWRALVTEPSVKLYFGLGLYKASSDADEGTWKKDDTILAQQVELGRELGCDGFMLYCYDQFHSDTAQAELENVMAVL